LNNLKIYRLSVYVSIVKYWNLWPIEIPIRIISIISQFIVKAIAVIPLRIPRVIDESVGTTRSMCGNEQTLKTWIGKDGYDSQVHGFSFLIIWAFGAASVSFPFVSCSYCHFVLKQCVTIQQPQQLVQSP
jgi:hypothetical protein